jgi:hypothetical protein
MPVVVNLPAIANKETLAKAPAMEEMPISNGENTIITNMENMMKAFEAWSFLRCNVYELRYGSYQTTSSYAIHAHHTPPHTPMNCPHSNVPMGPTYY